MSLNGASTYGTIAPENTSQVTSTTTNIGNGFIAFESPVDESTVETKTITVSGKILNPAVARVVISSLPATVDPVKQTFSLKNLPLTNRENNLVYRTYDVSGTLLGK